MKCIEAQKLFDRLDFSIKEINSFQNITEQEKVIFASHLIVLSSGIFEESIEQIFKQWTIHLNDEEAKKFINKEISKQFKNPDITNIKNILEKFGNKWRIKGSAVEQDALNSIIANKNLIAHGSSVTLTLNDSLDFINKAKKVIENLDKDIL